MQGWKRTRWHIGHRPIMTAAQTGRPCATRLAAQQSNSLANQSPRPYLDIDRKNGDVSYALNGKFPSSTADASSPFSTRIRLRPLRIGDGLQKYGSRIACTGTVEWKRMVTKVAANKASPSNSRTGDATRLRISNVWRTRANASRKSGR